MTKRHADSHPTLSLHEKDHPWYIRGYRPEVANSKRSPDEDPKGEIAYQRAFADAAKQNPPRVPNPSFYPNSPSAKSYIQKNAESVFSVRKKSSLPSTPASSSSPQSQQERLPSPRHEIPYSSHKPTLNIKLEPPSYSPASTSNGYSFSPMATKPVEEPRPFGSSPPMTLEPKLDAPRGPSKMLR
ncbi:uncharacterized protein A1O9_07890 [Exophiala aquamarina CBS 119918]|uniref:Uncharacterized protein n=1 Tax=Exophiala aquamarina CBS 119918 TaxID=1182545 RepID=A0A072P8A9_9EURO|nr:uncharacterized protein A1O9_07890 [Exophiala aquamarina CBS 119918]KEF56309.1 hypothetical protein A1O9_07890 [Exophiala aquamarina CBS 119918]